MDREEYILYGINNGFQNSIESYKCKDSNIKLEISPEDRCVANFIYNEINGNDSIKSTCDKCLSIILDNINYFEKDYIYFLFKTKHPKFKYYLDDCLTGNRKQIPYPFDKYPEHDIKIFERKPCSLSAIIFEKIELFFELYRDEEDIIEYLNNERKYYLDKLDESIINDNEEYCKIIHNYIYNMKMKIPENEMVKMTENEIVEIEKCYEKNCPGNLWFIPENPYLIDYTVKPGIYESTYRLFWILCKTDVDFNRIYRLNTNVFNCDEGTFINKRYKPISGTEKFDPNIINISLKVKTMHLNKYSIGYEKLLTSEHINIILSKYPWVEIVSEIIPLDLINYRKYLESNGINTNSNTNLEDTYKLYYILLTGIFVIPDKKLNIVQGIIPIDNYKDFYQFYIPYINII